MWGRDITFDQFGRYNLQVRRLLEQVYTSEAVDHETADFRALAEYLKRVWFSNGIYHHYGCEKFQPSFTADYLRQAMQQAGLGELSQELERVIFDASFMPKRVNKARPDLGLQLL